LDEYDLGVEFNEKLPLPLTTGGAEIIWMSRKKTLLYFFWGGVILTWELYNI